MLRYIYLLQSSIECSAHAHPLESEFVVYRGIRRDGARLVSLYESMIGEMIVWPGFTSTSTERDCVLEEFILDEDSMLFEITLYPGSVAVDLHRSQISAHEYESEILIAASSGFVIDEVDHLDIPNRGPDRRSILRIPLIRMRYSLSWSDFDIDASPVSVLIQSDETDNDMRKKLWRSKAMDSVFRPGSCT
jgi:hypothetical protein